MFGRKLYESFGYSMNNLPVNLKEEKNKPVPKLERAHEFGKSESQTLAVVINI